MFPGRHLAGSLRGILGASVLLAFSNVARSENVVYHLHKNASTTSGLFQLKSANIDETSLVIQSANLKNATGDQIVKAFDTQSLDPNRLGTIPSG